MGQFSYRFDAQAKSPPINAVAAERRPGKVLHSIIPASVHFLITGGVFDFRCRWHFSDIVAVFVHVSFLTNARFLYFARDVGRRVG